LRHLLPLVQRLLSEKEGNAAIYIRILRTLSLSAFSQALHTLQNQ
jgi:hypothetical protein